MLSTALEYAELGLATIPLWPDSKAPTKSWASYQVRAPSREDIVRMFSATPCNIAVVCGAPSGNLLALDCDTPSAFTEVGARLASAGIVTCTVQRPENGSPHDGGGHFWLRSPQPVRSSRVGNLEVRAQGQYVVAPPSTHPLGGQYGFGLSPESIFSLPSLKALEWLPLEAATLRPKIPRLASHLLEGDPAAVNHYSSRSEAEAALCASLTRAGFEFSGALNLMKRYPGPGKFAELYAKDPEDAFRYLSLTWHNATAFVATNESEAVRLARGQQEWALSRPWPGRTGATDQAVYLAHLRIVEQCGRQVYAAGSRELAEYAGVSAQTAAKATRRLQEANLLRLVQEAIGTLSAQYRMIWQNEAIGAFHSITSLASSEEQSNTNARLYTQSPTNVTECKAVLEHDTFRWAGLGKTGAAVFQELRRRGLAPEHELAAATGRHISTVRRKLSTMFQLGLAEPVEDGLWRCGAGNLDESAWLLGTAGIGAAQKTRHERQRIEHCLELERGRQDRWTANRQRTRFGHGSATLQ